MRLELNITGQRAEIALVGPLEAATVAAFRPMADRVLSETATEVVVRCDHLSALDSSGIGAIVFLHRRLVQQGRTLRLAGLGGQPLALARLIRLDTALGLALPRQPVRREVGVLTRLARLLRPAATRQIEA
jgi:anti-anti-sigma factor